MTSELERVGREAGRLLHRLRPDARHVPRAEVGGPWSRGRRAQPAGRLTEVREVVALSRPGGCGRIRWARPRPGTRRAGRRPLLRPRGPAAPALRTAETPSWPAATSPTGSLLLTNCRGCRTRVTNGDGSTPTRRPTRDGRRAEEDPPADRRPRVDVRRRLRPAVRAQEARRHAWRRRPGRPPHPEGHGRRRTCSTRSRGRPGSPGPRRRHPQSPSGPGTPLRASCNVHGGAERHRARVRLSWHPEDCTWRAPGRAGRPRHDGDDPATDPRPRHDHARRLAGGDRHRDRDQPQHRQVQRPPDGPRTTSSAATARGATSPP